MNFSTKKPDIIIIGAGVAGLSTAFHLKHHFGIQNVLLFECPEKSVTEAAAGWVSCGQFDNFTRISHAHGAAPAANLWSFGNLAFTNLMTFAQRFSISHYREDRERLIVSESEMQESIQASRELRENGFNVELSLEQQTNFLSSRVIGRQIEGNSGGFVDPLALLKTLKNLHGIDAIASQIMLLRENGRHIEVVDSKGNCFQSEIVVVAAHLGTRILLPEIAEAFVPVVTQWIEVQLHNPVNIRPGYAFSANHGYEWGVFKDEVICRIGGAQFIRKLAGIGWETAPIDDRITNYLSKQMEMTFLGAKVKRILRTVAGLDCRPCDELPIVGPMFGSNRILVAGGFMGMGLSQGFQAGQCLAELIATGRSLALPRLIYPERLRTL